MKIQPIQNFDQSVHEARYRLQTIYIYTMGVRNNTVLFTETSCEKLFLRCVSVTFWQNNSCFFLRAFAHYGQFADRALYIC